MYAHPPAHTAVQPACPQAGYDEHEAAAFLSAYWGTLFGNDVVPGSDAGQHGHVSNMATDLQLRGGSWYRAALAQVGTQVFSRKAGLQASLT